MRHFYNIATGKPLCGARPSGAAYSLDERLAMVHAQKPAPELCRECWRLQFVGRLLSRGPFRREPR